ncbi:hypothetical protein DPMN_070802 [Dreissena polymorpha]|uniref:Uncharacterized protein n=1 Tax=Dreissena polymorpha TaxID=45954 RepID=A0A9D3Z6L5_DREPO|nr:hypothetical protein DPMN_070802 [Dreissena polymorpha]
MNAGDFLPKKNYIAIRALGKNPGNGPNMGHSVVPFPMARITEIQKINILLGVGSQAMMPDARPSQAASIAPTLARLLHLNKKSIFTDLAGASFLNMRRRPFRDVLSPHMQGAKKKQPFLEATLGIDALLRCLQATFQPLYSRAWDRFLKEATLRRMIPCVKRAWDR